jgi:hypothetical protein
VNALGPAIVSFTSASLASPSDSTASAILIIVLSDMSPATSTACAMGTVE